MFSKKDLQTNEYHPYYELYLARVEGYEELMESFHKSKHDFIDFLNSIPEQKYHFQYQEGKWTIKEIVQHIIDTERIFCYRALRIARGDKTPLPGFDENAFVPPSKANLKSMPQLIKEYTTLREANIALFEGCDKQMLTCLGEASAGPVSVRAIPFILVGHERHHIHIFETRYK